MKLQFQIPKSEPRDIDQITEHYVLEKHLAWTLRHSRKEERLGLYTLLYDELFRNIPHHPQSTRKDDKAASWQEVSRKMNLVKPYLKPDTIFVEIGPGDCQFAFEISKTVEQIFAVDVSEEITQNGSTPSNFNLIISNGCSIPLADGTASVVYSNQLMEHLHPEDSRSSLKKFIASCSLAGTISALRLIDSRDPMIFLNILTGSPQAFTCRNIPIESCTTCLSQRAFLRF